MYRISLLLPVLLITGIFTTTRADYSESSGCFSIEGFSDSHLIWQDDGAASSEIVTALGDTPNDLLLYNGFLYVVHSGSFADGSGAELWRTSLAEVWEKLQEDDPVDWQVITFADWSNPWAFAADGEYGAVSLMGSNGVAIIDLLNWEVQNTTNVAGNPEGLTFSDTHLFVACSGFGTGNTVAVLSRATWEVTDIFSTAINPQCVSWQAPDQLFVLCSGITWPADGEGRLQQLDSSTGELLLEVPLGNNSGTMALLNSGLIALGDEYTTTGDPVQFFSVADGELLQQTISTGGFALADRPDGGLYIGSSMMNTVTRYSDELELQTTWNHSQPVVDICGYTPNEGINCLCPDPLPESLQVMSIAPNPFNPVTRVQFSLGVDARVAGALFNILGQQVRTIAPEYRVAGVHQLTIHGEGLTAGVYLLRLSSDQGTVARARLTYLP